MTKTKAKPKRNIVLPVVCVSGSIGGELHSFAVEENDTITSIFAKANISITDTTEVLARQTGDTVDPNSKPVPNYIYYVSQKFKSQRGLV